MPDPAALLPAHLAFTAAMAGVLWVVQLAVYPLFGAVAPAEFVAYHRRYATRISLVVLPLMLAELGTAAALWLGGLRGPVFLGSLVLLAVAWISTAALQVPRHRRLAAGYEAATHRRLVLSNWLRTGAWTARVVLLLLLIP
ncbi:hypothetical protein [Lacunisphaera limnophila]|nr:hypothetical protein [Lacunisphaera limnophila]